MKPNAALPNRFYKEPGIAPREDGFALLLDGCIASTPSKHPLVLPSHAFAQAVAEEWNAQKDYIDISAMPLTRLAHSAIDGVALRPESVIDVLIRYAGSDLICYRAANPERLVGMQAEAWNPILEWARGTMQASFVLAEGVIFVEQPEVTLTALHAELRTASNPFTLATLHVMTTLTGSLLIALAHWKKALTAEAAWAAAHVDETFQESVWGQDHEAAERRSRRKAEFMTASKALALFT